MSRVAAMACLTGIVLLVGCAPAVKITTWRSPPIETADLHAIALAPVAGKHEFAAIAEERLAGSIAEHPWYELVGDRVMPLDGIGDDIESTPPHAIVHRGQLAGADAVLICEVAHNSKDLFGSSSGFQFGDPKLSMTLTAKIIDARSGQVRCEQAWTETFSDDFDMRGSQGRSTDQIYRQLADRCAERLMLDLLAGSRIVEVPLATVTHGSAAKAVRAGNRHAMEGRWQQAADEWNRALDEDQDCDAAWYNLGVAAEAHYDFVEAIEFYQQAQRNRSLGMYERAIARSQSTNDRRQVTVR